MPASDILKTSTASEKSVHVFDPCRDLFSNPLLSQNYGVLILNSPTRLVNSNLWEIWNNGKNFQCFITRF